MEVKGSQSGHNFYIEKIGQGHQKLLFFHDVSGDLSKINPVTENHIWTLKTNI